MRWIILLVLIATTNALDFTEATWDINLYGSTAKPVTSYIKLDNNPPSNQELTIGNIPYENGSYVLEGKNYDLSFTVRTREVPAKDKDSDPDSYLDNTYYIDTSGEIQELARSLRAETKERSVQNIVSWIHSSITIDSGKTKASQVISSKKADNLGAIALFLSLTREMDIPSRFVYGLAYNDEIINPHAWAEVKTDDWIPVDLKFMQVGSLDASHIKFYDNPTIDTKIVRHVAEGEKIDISNMNFSAELVSSKNNTQLHPRIIPYISTMGPESYNLIEIILENPFDDPVYLKIDLPTKGIRIIEGPEPFVYLSPGEQHQRHYIIQNTVEDMPFDIREKESGRHIIMRNPLQLELKAREDGEVLSLEQVRNIGKPHIIEEPQKAKPTITGNITEVNLDHLLEQFNKTSEVIDVKKVIHFDNKTNTTSVYLNISTTENLKNVSVYEEIPKCLTEIVQNVRPGDVDFEVINPDPLIVWNFDEVNDSITISYDVLKTLKNISCEDETATMTVAERIGGEVGEDSSYMAYLIIFLIMAGVVSIIVIYRRFTNV